LGVLGGVGVAPPTWRIPIPFLIKSLDRSTQTGYTPSGAQDTKDSPEGQTMRDLSNVIWGEMTPTERKRFEREWVAQYAHDLVVECDEDPAEAAESAEWGFERWLNQEGWTARDERIHMRRERTHAR